MNTVNRKNDEQMNSILENTEHSCSGCGACTVVCPVKAIRWAENENGFFAPIVEKKLCIQCGLCKKVCSCFQLEDTAEKSLENSNMYAARSKTKKNLKNCTSGGIAFELSNWAIQQGYYIVGTIYNIKTQRAEMRIAKSKEEVLPFRGSKYLQSNPNGAIEELLKLAENDPQQKFVLFGTPCQIFGIRKSIQAKKLSNEVVYVDLFCHGVPSYLIWDKFREEIGFLHPEQVEFRDHKAPWHFFNLYMRQGTKEIAIDKEKATFYQMFFDNYGLNDACGTCRFRKAVSVADIRLGDFWGKRYKKDFEGVSLCAVMTERGWKVMKAMAQQQDIEIMESVLPQEGLSAQSTYNYESTITEVKEKILAGHSLSQMVQKNRSKATVTKKVKWWIKGMISKMPLKLQMGLRKLF